MPASDDKRINLNIQDSSHSSSKGSGDSQIEAIKEDFDGNEGGHPKLGNIEKVGSDINTMVANNESQSKQFSFCESSHNTQPNIFLSGDGYAANPIEEPTSRQLMRE